MYRAHRTATCLVLSFAFATLALAAPSPAPAATVPGQVVVGYDAPDGIDRQVVAVDGSASAEAARLRRQDDVVFAEPVYRTHGAARPAASGFASQWALENTGQSGGLAGADIDGPRAWDIRAGGSPSVLVGIVDSGVQLDHPGLAGAAVWTNARERAGNGRDDDGNGCVDDLHGCDFIDRDGDPSDRNGHGTAAAGIALGSHGSVYAGVAPGSGLIAARALDASNSGTTAALADALDYAADNGARVVNVSVAGPRSQAVARVIAEHPQTLFVAASGNDGAGEDRATYPCAEPAANVICVAASDRRDAMARFSNTGPTAVDLAAPGQAVGAPTLGGGTATWSGTSMAAPLVAGTAALALAARPDATVAQLRQAILDGAERLPAMSGLTATGGRLSAYRALSLALGRVPAPRPSPASVSSPRGAPAGARRTTRSRSARLRVASRVRRRGTRGVLAVRCLPGAACRGKVSLASRGGRTGRAVRFAVKAGARSRVLVSANAVRRSGRAVVITRIGTRVSRTLVRVR